MTLESSFPTLQSRRLLFSNQLFPLQMKGDAMRLSTELYSRESRTFLYVFLSNFEINFPFLVYFTQFAES